MYQKIILYLKIVIFSYVCPQTLTQTILRYTTKSCEQQEYMWGITNNESLKYKHLSLWY